MGFPAQQLQPQSQPRQLGKHLSDVSKTAIVIEQQKQQTGDLNPLVHLMEQLRLEIETKDSVLVAKEESVLQLHAQLRVCESELQEVQKKLTSANGERVKNIETVRVKIVCVCVTKILKNKKTNTQIQNLQEAVAMHSNTIGQLEVGKTKLENDLRDLQKLVSFFLPELFRRCWNVKLFCMLIHFEKVSTQDNSSIAFREKCRKLENEVRFFEEI